MPGLPATDLRYNLATWAVGTALLPAAGAALAAALPAESFDPDFHGQRLCTTYFDTDQLTLRRARRKGNRYLTLRLRHYHPTGLFALSFKTEAVKERRDVDRATARAILSGDDEALREALPAEAVARLAELVGAAPLLPVVEVHCHRFAREDAHARLTLDTAVHTDTGLVLPFAVLEAKDTRPDGPLPSFPAALGLRPAKVSKFLWATQGGH
jgi:hypothetical protein